MRPWLYRWEVDFLGDLSLPSYFFMVTLAFLIATSLVVREGRRVGFRPLDMLDLSMIAFGAGLLGARLVHVFFEAPFVEFTEEFTVNVETWSHWLCQRAGHPHGPGTEWNLGRYYLLHPHMVLAVWMGGIVYYGGVIGGLIAGAWFCIRRKLPILTTGDVAMPILLTGLVYGRGGCLLAGCCHGKQVQGWMESWGVVFYSSQVEETLRGHLLHPTQVYESMAALGMVLALLWLRRFKQYEGQVFAWGIAVYALWRPLVELLRADSQRGVHLGVSTSQLISLAMLGFAGYLAWVGRSSRR